MFASLASVRALTVSTRCPRALSALARTVCSVLIAEALLATWPVS